jgi:hypothetical protein
MNIKLRSCLVICSLCLPACAATAQGPASGPQNASQAPVPYASVSQLNALLSQVQEAAQSTSADLNKLRVDRWKTDGGNRRQVQGDVQSVQRNLQSALPEIINQLQASPEDLTQTFKLYRNLDALYDVFGSIVESAGAFGSRDEFQSLSNDLSALERARRSLADRMENLTTQKEAELGRLRTEVKALAAAPAAPPKKVIVDDTEEPKKPVKKKSTKKPTTPATAQSPSQPQKQQQSQPQPQ